MLIQTNRANGTENHIDIARQRPRGFEQLLGTIAAGSGLVPLEVCRELMLGRTVNAGSHTFHVARGDE